MFTRCFAIVVLVCLAAALGFASTGTMTFRVRDSRTHHPVQATIKGDGPQSFSVTTDAKGSGKIDLTPGEYYLEISASGYDNLRTHYLVEDGRTTKAGAYLDSKSVPEEESPKALDPLIRRGHTLLHEYVVDADTGEPLNHVTVRVVQANVEAQTDSKGHFVSSIPTPEPENPGGIGTDTLTYEKPGYTTLELQNFGIGSDDMGPVAVELRRGKGVRREDATHKLMRNESENEENLGPALQSQALSPELCSLIHGSRRFRNPDRSEEML